MPYTKVTRDQFDVLPYKIIHRPTGATFTSYPGRDKEISYTNWGRCGDVLPNGQDYWLGCIAALATVGMGAVILWNGNNTAIFLATAIIAIVAWLTGRAFHYVLSGK